MPIYINTFIFKIYIVKFQNAKKTLDFGFIK
jgi:hypothetical protein